MRKALAVSFNSSIDLSIISSIVGITPDILQFITTCYYGKICSIQFIRLINIKC